VFLVNEQLAIPVLRDLAECVFCSHNALLDPRRYPISKGHRRYDAIYVARITPFKRHALAAKVRNLHLIGSHSVREEDYFREIMRTVPYARWDEKVNSLLIGRRIAQASCGLALSAIEGAMFACGEYSLCGIPVVNTANYGGRDSLLPEFSAFRAADTPESVADGVEHWNSNPVPPQEIREAFLRMAAEHRARLDDLLASIAGKRVKIPHKLGIRCRLLPLQKLLHGVRRRD
jgi:glycosyltransferase involved in cell wall biosynthesis